MGGILKRIIESALLHGGPAALSRRSVRYRALILAYHNILPDGATPGQDRSLHLPRKMFVEQLDLLTRVCEVVPLTPGLLAPARANSGRPRVAITFDDAYQGAVTVGVEELRRRSLPGTIFVSPGFIGGKTFWWDALNEGTGTLSDATRRYALDNCRGEDAAIREWAVANGYPLAELGPPLTAATQLELEHAMTYEGLTLGSHTWSHPNLALLDLRRLESELIAPAQWLSERFNRVIPWISYPYGSSSPAVESAAEQAGYEAGLLVTGGWISRNRVSRFAIPRLNIPAGVSLEGFALRLAGLLTN
jgi:peptidoglycan/xylan/chitin deacetylase (PgdA/CDA1 family)